ncbi:prepilin-type N-terminal cleavage/methylation domain-containing protein [Lysobacter sp. TY2-98]|uniref:prepilin-type N-terminal cleavage/methylation domain-containing protein n=1 Tax=Lysobacter sp. TY2-98 TaxID=2290922 RepID=UPI000E1FE51E|nr:prepilin-type N-terminal cleavage/methylation domain-containing protein [Lysobacter sp. TY2-98]AXK70934.1 prepilin-type N-terminal cleavage/methylation domain-containing protein [Lysobacter sp. TY2-98]
MRRARGFTLIEVLIATVLLAAGLTLAFATITGATGATRHGEATAASNEHIRAVEGFLRRRLAGARAVSFQIDPSTGQAMRFAGDAERMRFVSDLPDYIGRGGPSVHDLRIQRMASGDGVRLTLGLVAAQPGDATAAVDREPEVLAENLRSVEFHYRGVGEDGKPAEWQDDWTTTEQLPLLVEIRITGEDGKPWPVLDVAPRLAAAYATGITR